MGKGDLTKFLRDWEEKQYSATPSKILASDELRSLPLSCRALLQGLGSFLGARREGYASTNEIAANSGLSRSTVIRDVRLLREAGLLALRHRRRKYGGLTANRYRLIPPPSIRTAAEAAEIAALKAAWETPEEESLTRRLRGQEPGRAAARRASTTPPPAPTPIENPPDPFDDPEGFEAFEAAAQAAEARKPVQQRGAGYELAREFHRLVCRDGDGYTPSANEIRYVEQLVRLHGEEGVRKVWEYCARKFGDWRPATVFAAKAHLKNALAYEDPHTIHARELEQARLDNEAAWAAQEAAEAERQQAAEADRQRRQQEAHQAAEAARAELGRLLPEIVTMLSQDIEQLDSAPPATMTAAEQRKHQAEQTARRSVSAGALDAARRDLAYLWQIEGAELIGQLDMRRRQIEALRGLRARRQAG